MADIQKINAFVNPEQVGRILTLCWKASRIAASKGLDLRIPVGLVGDTGVGKTTAVRAFYEKLARQLAKKDVKLNLEIMLLSMLPPEDLGGLPYRDDKTKKVLHAMMAHLPFDCDDYTIIFGDEVDRGSNETQNAFLQILLGGKYHGHQLSPNAYPVVALNGTSDIYTNPLSQAARTRMCTIFMSRKATDSATSYDRWAIRNGIPQVCRTFNEQYGTLIQSTDEFEELAVCTPRTLDMCGLVTLAKHEVDAAGSYETDDIYLPIISGLIGLKAGATYLGVEKALMQGVDPESVLDDPKSAELMEDPSMIYYLIQAACALVKDKYNHSEKKIRALAIYGMRHEVDEWKEIWMSTLLKEFPDFASDDLHRKWVQYKKSRKLGVM